ncbi:YggS family pyridoxal phosphate-dependent enzyme [Hymenobacter koreensis]|uniref:Pyridoxal phosphate homeostasis protein n=1 Tax=Hymenobacter koreensis TaxID=1084523 RepID=A0ABP8J3C6_9BACT
MIKDALAQFQQALSGSNCRLVAVSKTHPVELIQEAYEAGQRLFGENRVQELVAKQPELPADIEWHLIGHLQTNKVKYIAPFVHTIQSVDSLKLLLEIERQAARHNRVVRVLLQFHIAEEETKFGLSLPEAEALLRDEAARTLSHVQIAGVMGVATNTSDEQQLRHEFGTLRGYFEQLRREFFADDEAFREISMGMSGDFRLAIAEGSTLIRVGSAIFGNRAYPAA